MFSVLGKNGVMFAKFMRRSMIALASGDHELEFNCFMSSRTVSPEGWKTLEYILKQKHTSLNHTTGLNRALDYIDGDYVVLSDTDIAILSPNWDRYLINTIQNKNIDILGVDHWENNRGYQKFPIVTFFIAKSQSHLRAQPDLRPNLVKYPNKHGQGANVITVNTQEEAYIYGKKIGSDFLQDSGWQLPYKYKTAGLRGRIFSKSEQLIQQIPQIWNFDEEIGICHKGKGSKRRQSHASKFFKAVRAYVKQSHGIEIK